VSEFLGEILKWDAIEHGELMQLEPHPQVGDRRYFHRPCDLSFDFYAVRNDSGQELLGKRLVKLSEDWLSVTGPAQGPIFRNLACTPPYTQPIPPGAIFWVAVRGHMSISLAEAAA
jgi:hypothetical protein